MRGGNRPNMTYRQKRPISSMDRRNMRSRRERSKNSRVKGHVITTSGVKVPGSVTCGGRQSSRWRSTGMLPKMLKHGFNIGVREDRSGRIYRDRRR